MSCRSIENSAEGAFRRLWLATAAAAAAGALMLVLGIAPAPALAATCSRVASPAGSDGAAGSEASPYRTVQKLADSLQPGETGCLRAGTFAGNVSISKPGDAGAPLTITSYPGERATVAGKLWVKDTADFVTISSLDLDGRNPANLPSPAVNGDDVAFVGNDVTNHHTAICFNIGPTTYGRANRTLIERNRIHDCGRLPSANLDHGIYVEHATGARIVDNVIHDNSDRGVQLYPDAQGSYIARNVIDVNGEGVLIGGGSEDYGPQASSDNVVEHNIITNSTQRYNVESHWGSAFVGERNVVRSNCIHGGARDADRHGLAPDSGFSSSSNVLADPRYVNRAARDYRLAAGSPCADLARAHSTPAPAAGSTIVLNAGTTGASPGAAIRLSGRVSGPRRPADVTLRTRVGRRWKRVKRVRVRRNGRFSTRVRLRRRGARSARSLVLQKARLSRATRAVRLDAVASGVGRSNTVRVRVKR